MVDITQLSDQFFQPPACPSIANSIRNFNLRGAIELAIEAECFELNVIMSFERNLLSACKLATGSGATARIWIRVGHNNDAGDGSTDEGETEMK